MNKNVVILLAVLVGAGCRTNTGLRLIELEEGRELFVSARIEAYIRENVSLDIAVEPGGKLELVIANRGNEMVAVDPNNILWVLHCDPTRWLPLKRDALARLHAPVFVQPGTVHSLQCDASLSGFVLSPGHQVQAFYHTADGRILRASRKILYDDSMIAPKTFSIPGQQPAHCPVAVKQNTAVQEGDTVAGGIRPESGIIKRISEVLPPPAVDESRLPEAIDAYFEPDK